MTTDARFAETHGWIDTCRERGSGGVVAGREGEGTS